MKAKNEILMIYKQTTLENFVKKAAVEIKNTFNVGGTLKVSNQIVQFGHDDLLRIEIHQIFEKFQHFVAYQGTQIEHGRELLFLGEKKRFGSFEFHPTLRGEKVM